MLNESLFSDEKLSVYQSHFQIFTTGLKLVQSKLRKVVFHFNQQELVNMTP